MGVPGTGVLRPRGMSPQVLVRAHFLFCWQKAVRTLSRLEEPREVAQADGLMKPHLSVRSMSWPLLVLK